jgi:hypothetical protein
MSRRTIFAVGATALLAVAGLLAGTAPASATTTQTTHSTVINAAIPVSCDGPGVTAYQGTGNSVMHLTINNAGDSWFTQTTEGTVTLTTTWNGKSTTWTGHAAEWFGAEDNNKNSVQHATFNFQGVSATDTSMTLSMHAAFTTTTNANGVITVNNQTVTCR